MKPNGYWTLDKCKEDALKYQTKKEWSEASCSGYHAAKKHKWLEYCCSHMREINKPHGYWTKERCREEALKYKTRTEWFKNSCSYTIAKNNKWLEECCTHMEELQKPSGYWNLERCKEDSLQFQTRKEWGNKSRGAYKAAIRNKWLEDCCSHMEEIKKHKNYWTLDKCKESALKFETRKEWSENSEGCYESARWNKWMDECCSHMKYIGHRYKRMIYAYEFPDNHVYIGLTYYLKQRNRSHANDENSSVYKHIQKMKSQPILKEISDYIPVEEAQKLEEETKNKYQENGWIILNKAKTGGIGSMGGVKRNRKNFV